jgi:hypothetical protein
MPKNLPLKMAIFASGMRQIDVAKAADIHESRLSHIINGHRVASGREQTALGAVLRRTPAQLGFRTRTRRKKPAAAQAARIA